MAAAPDRNTGLPYRGANPYQEQSYGQTALQTTGPRTDVIRGTGTEATNQAVSGSSSAMNTTPAALAALDQVIGQLLGTPARPAPTLDTLDAELPLLVAKRHGGRVAGDYAPGHKGTVLYHDPQTGRMYREEEGIAINKQRMAQRTERMKQGATAATPGGTPEMQQQQAERKEEISRNRGTQAAYSKEAAFKDSQALVDKAISDALERVLPNITASIEGSGTSKGSMAALLTQRAAEKAGSEGAALGAQTAVAYGGINATLANTLEMLTRSDPNSPTALLLQAVLGSKGLVSQQTQNQNTSGVSQKTSEQKQQIGPQSVLTDTLKQIMEPLSAFNALSVPSSTRTNVGPAVSTKPRRTGASDIVIAVNDDTTYGTGGIAAQDDSWEVEEM